MLNNIKLSVIVPVYKVEKFLRKALESLINQSYKNIEIITIDNGCKDNCSSIIQEYAKKDERIKVLKFIENIGYGAACNKGLEIASGDYISIFEPDDWVENNMYETLIDMAKDGLDIIKCDFNNIFEDKIVKNVISKSVSINANSFSINQNPLFLFIHPSIWTCIYKKDFLIKNNIKFVESDDASWQDNPFQLQTMCLAKNILFIPQALYNYRRKSHNEVNELKNWHYPFDCIKEMNMWLKQNQINNENVLACYYKRNLFYIKTSIKAFKLFEYKEIIQTIKEVVCSIDAKIIANNSYITKTEKKFYKTLLKLSLIKLLNLRWFDGSFRRWLISVHFKKNGFVRIFGIQFSW